MLRIVDSILFSRLLWPKFHYTGLHYEVCVDDEAILDDHRDTSACALESHEWFVNHYHLFDFVEHDIPVVTHEEDEWLEEGHEDFRGAWVLTKTLVDVWAAKLAVDFPGVPFAIAATRVNGPIIRFFCRRGDVYLGPLDTYFSKMIADDAGYYVLTK